jgi:hypothetical protein
MDGFNVENGTRFFMWASIISIGMLWATVILWRFFRPMAHRIHGGLFGVKPETVDMAAYAFLGLWKILLVVLFLVPWLALLVMG